MCGVSQLSAKAIRDEFKPIPKPGKEDPCYEQPVWISPVSLDMYSPLPPAWACPHQRQCRIHAPYTCTIHMHHKHAPHACTIANAPDPYNIALHIYAHSQHHDSHPWAITPGPSPLGQSSCAITPGPSPLGQSSCVLFLCIRA